MKVHLTHSTEIKTFDDVVRHLELEEDMMKSSKPELESYVTNAGVQNNQGSKHKFKGEKGKGNSSVPKKPMTTQQGK